MRRAELRGRLYTCLQEVNETFSNLSTPYAVYLHLHRSWSQPAAYKPPLPGRSRHRRSTPSRPFVPAPGCTLVHLSTKKSCQNPPTESRESPRFLTKQPFLALLLVRMCTRTSDPYPERSTDQSRTAAPALSAGELRRSIEAQQVAEQRQECRSPADTGRRVTDQSCMFWRRADRYTKHAKQLVELSSTTCAPGLLHPVRSHRYSSATARHA